MLKCPLAHVCGLRKTSTPEGKTYCVSWGSGSQPQAQDGGKPSCLSSAPPRPEHVGILHKAGIMSELQQDPHLSPHDSRWSLALTWGAPGSLHPPAMASFHFFLTGVFVHLSPLHNLKGQRTGVKWQQERRVPVCIFSFSCAPHFSPLSCLAGVRNGRMCASSGTSRPLGYWLGNTRVLIYLFQASGRSCRKSLVWTQVAKGSRWFSLYLQLTHEF